MLDAPLRQPHSGKREEENFIIVKDLRQPDPEAKQVALNEFVLTQAILTHKHMGTLAFVHGRVPGVSISISR